MKGYIIIGYDLTRNYTQFIKENPNSTIEELTNHIFEDSSIARKVQFLSEKNVGEIRCFVTKQYVIFGYISQILDDSTPFEPNTDVPILSISPETVDFALHLANISKLDVNYTDGRQVPCQIIYYEDTTELMCTDIKTRYENLTKHIQTEQNLIFQELQQLIIDCKLDQDVTFKGNRGRIKIRMYADRPGQPIIDFHRYKKDGTLWPSTITTGVWLCKLMELSNEQIKEQLLKTFTPVE